MDRLSYLTFGVALCVAALSAVCFSLSYLFLSLTQLIILLDVLFPEAPESSANGLKQVMASISYSLIGGQTPMYLNQSAFAMAALLLALVVLLVLIEEALLRVKKKVRMWGKLPSVDVLHHYNNNSYGTALAKVGMGLTTKKTM
ncbi:hypothetical protein ABL78_4438 [Leptomonas seymouri]|uniref:Uncharacterized protein n=1 Tax=Leptomonas seymouri TaxID=5684 RepID=A0A0N1PBU8_LEPSE|nr:hypothetical protein ABL78_4438 [Leptomonas seymouri]|eukprot:KPI86498.1 hypothetical protein ABL78_4438 [Leptomonas seymouri]